MNKAAQLQELLQKRIAIIDGAMGTMVYAHKLDERAVRGERFKSWHRDVKNLPDLLNLTRPDIIESIHRQYLEAGADIIKTNTFNAQAISLADYEMQPLAYELAKAGAELARRAVENQRGRSCFVAGSIGPTTRTSSSVIDVSNPALRGATYDELVAAYTEQIRGLIDGGADILLVETIFDTLNAKAALFAIESYFEKIQRRLPVMASVTFIAENSDRNFIGQTVEAFWNSVSHVPLLSVGINCALGPKELRPLVEDLSRIAPLFVSSHPNAGLPNPMLREQSSSK